MTPNAGAGSKAPTATRISRSRTCRSASTASGAKRRAADAAGGQRLNALFALGASPRAALRARLSELLDADGPERREVEGMKPLLLTRAADCEMHMQARVGNFTD